MSNVESNVAVMNGLFNNWSLINPSKDTVSATQNPARIHFTTRYYAYAPLRIHPFQISVRRQPEQFTPIQFGQVTKYLNDKGILIDAWVLTGPQQSFEQAETSWYAMMQEIKRIIRVNGTQFGSATLSNKLQSQTLRNGDNLSDSPHRRLADPQRTTVLRGDNVRDTPGKPRIHTCGIRASSNVSIRPEDACDSTAWKRGS